MCLLRSAPAVIAAYLSLGATVATRDTRRIIVDDIALEHDTLRLLSVHLPKGLSTVSFTSEHFPEAYNS